MLHKLSLDKQHSPVLLASIGIGIYEYILIWRANIARLVHII